MVGALIVAAIWIGAGGVLIVWIWWLGRPHRLMHAEISARCASPETPALNAPEGGTPPTAGAGNPDAAPAVDPPRVRVTYRGTYGQVA